MLEVIVLAGLILTGAMYWYAQVIKFVFYILGKMMVSDSDTEQRK